MVGKNPIVLVGTKMDLLPDGTHPKDIAGTVQYMYIGRVDRRVEEVQMAFLGYDASSSL